MIKDSPDARNAFANLVHKHECDKLTQQRAQLLPLAPAQAGTQGDRSGTQLLDPACAGMSGPHFAGDDLWDC